MYECMGAICHNLHASLSVAIMKLSYKGDSSDCPLAFLYWNVTDFGDGSSFFRKILKSSLTPICQTPVVLLCHMTTILCRKWQHPLQRNTSPTKVHQHNSYLIISNYFQVSVCFQILPSKLKQRSAFYALIWGVYIVLSTYSTN